MLPAIIHLLDPLQSRPVHGNLIIHLVRLASDAINVLVLCIHFLAHSLSEVAETFSGAVEGIYHSALAQLSHFTNIDVRTQIAIDFILHLVVFRVGLELVFGAVRERALLLAGAHVLQAAGGAVVARGRVPGSFARGIALFALLAVGFHAVDH
jgi:hypothetical protein